jgi:glyoxylase-like metal-dependent hydrolase (beta-lactamase superfamily II)
MFVRARDRWSDEIVRIPIEMPSASSPVNLYLLRGERLTLVDTGPNLPDALAQLEQQLAALGVAVGDLQQIVVTHPHIDHMGLASRLRERGAGELLAPRGSAWWLAAYGATDARHKRWGDRLMRRHGVPEQAIAASRHSAPFRASWDPSVPVDRELADGELLEAGERTWRVLMRPGHSPYDMLLHDVDDGTLLVGDHLIDSISSNPVIAPTRHPAEQRTQRPLVDYRASLTRTRALNASRVLSGHGGPIDDHVALIDRRIASIDRRTAVVACAIADGSATAHAVARVIWGERAHAEPWLTLCEVLGHVDLLRERGLLEERSEGPLGPITLVPT